MSAMTDKLGITTRFIYDKNGNVLSLKDGEDRVYTYDAANRLTVEP